MAEFRNQKPKEKNQNIQVFVRVRPLNASEKASKSCSVVDTGRKEVTVKERPADKITKTFTFDRVFGTDSQQVDVYKTVVHPLINEVLAGYNCTIFAYGQTGTGKTFTMEGEPSKDCGTAWDSDPLSGIIPRTLSHMFDELRILQAEYTVRVTYLELYNEELFDLLAPGDDNAKIKLYEDVNKKGSVVITGLEEVTVNSKDEVYGILKKGSLKRQTAATLMNAQSSRSHSVFSITIHIKENNLDGEELLKTGKMNLVDLAGSECVGRSGAVDKRAREAGNINQSLLTLGRCISSLVERTPHVPFRESKLTRILQDSLGGKTKTSIIATISPAAINLEETLSTLDYAHRAKNITNRPEINQKLTKKALLKEYTEEIETLRKDLAASRDKNGVYLATENYTQMLARLDFQEKENVELISKMRAVNDEKEKMEKICEDLGMTLRKCEITLQETEEELHGTQKNLRVTQVKLVQTKQACEEQTLLVEKHVETEEKLGQQAHEVLAVAEESTADADKLQETLERKRAVEFDNTNVANTFSQQFIERLENMKDSLASFVQEQGQFCSTLKKNTNDHQAEEKAGLECISNQMSELLSQLNQQILGIQSKISVQAQSSQVWIQQELTSSRSYSDAESNNLHQVLHEMTPLLQSLLLKIKSMQVSKDKFSRTIDQQLSRQTEIVKNHHTSVTHSFSQLLEKMSVLNHVLYTDLEKSKNIANDLAQQLEDQEEANIALMENMHKMLKVSQDTRKKYMANVNADFSRFYENVEVTAKTVALGLEVVSKEYQDFNGVHQVHVGNLRESCTNIVDRTSAFTTDTERIHAKLDSGIYDGLRSGMNAWKDGYIRTELSLRTRSEEVTSELQQQLDDIQEMQVFTSDSANAHEALLETQHEKLDVNAKEKLSNIISLCSHVQDWNEKMATSLQERKQTIQKYVTEDFIKDQPSGVTPVKKVFALPQTFAATSPHERIIARYRAEIGHDDEMYTSSGVESGSSSPSPVESRTIVDAPKSDERKSQEKVDVMDRLKSASTSNLLDVPSVNVDFNSSTESDPCLNEENKENSLKGIRNPLAASKAPSASDPCLKKEPNPRPFLQPAAVKKIPLVPRGSRNRVIRTEPRVTKMPLSMQNKPE